MEFGTLLEVIAMTISCPKCDRHLYLLVHTKHFFSIKSIGLNDVTPGEPMDIDKFYSLNCLDCHWSGWTDDYHEAISGVTRLFPKDHKVSVQKSTGTLDDNPDNVIQLFPKEGEPDDNDNNPDSPPEIHA